MAVASFEVDGQARILRGFDPPKTASLTHWYRAAVGQIASAPAWREVVDIINAADVDADTIIFHGNGWTLWIARKRFLK